MKVLLSRNDDACSEGFLQSRFWADFKALAGWTYTRYTVTVDGCASFALSVLERGLGASLRFAYIPHGPEAGFATCSGGDLLVAIAEQLRLLVSPACVFIRFDPAWYETESCGNADPVEVTATENVPPVHHSGAALVRPVFRKPLVKASDVQPPDSVVLAVDKPDDALLAGMKPKWRYNVRLAEKKSVKVAAEGAQSLEEFYSLYQTTAARDHIAIHPKTYYQRLLALSPSNSSEPMPDLRLWIARHEGNALAAIITVFYGKEATYLYGASSDEHRNLMPAYALQWAAIRAARDAGCLTYDFYGIPPVDDPNHAMSGLYRFKTSFGGEIRHYSGAWDYVLKPVLYAAFRTVERARLFWHKNVKKWLGR